MPGRAERADPDDSWHSDSGRGRTVTRRSQAAHGSAAQVKNGEGEPVAWRTQTPFPDPGPVSSALPALPGQTRLVPVLEPVSWGDLEASCWDTAAIADLDQVDVAALLEELWADRYPEPSQVSPGWDEARQLVDELVSGPPRRSSMSQSGTSGGTDSGTADT